MAFLLNALQYYVGFVVDCQILNNSRGYASPVVLNNVKLLKIVIILQITALRNT